MPTPGIRAGLGGVDLKPIFAGYAWNERRGSDGFALVRYFVQESHFQNNCKDLSEINVDKCNIQWLFYFFVGMKCYKILID